MDRTTTEWKLSLNLRAGLLAVVILALLLGLWEGLNRAPILGGGAELSEYEMLLGGADETASVPPPSAIMVRAWEQLSDPFYDAGPNDKGIGIQLGYSLYRVLAGYLMAAAVAIPIGFLIGMSPLMYKALNPFIQVLRPISPLAWMPLALFIIRDAEASAIFVIFICSIWPMLLNTAFGVAGVRSDWVNVARTHELSSLKTAFKVILPAAAPTILTGMRISIGIAWLVIVAAEMLVGGTGIGYYVWNEWNNLDLTSVIFSILMIGIVGMLLDMSLAYVARFVTYAE
ncbi:nitrate ABC transporter permease [Halomonas sp. M1]|uniref:nitrate ABC transporter permease n=1 Tax=Halomonas sp. M1 TaxID=3035470 RepID=UPI002485E465|nr:MULTISPECIES: nitrate ABC transporter permease [unclassified Halomonas]MDP3536315.1 nitrate ABC transporter permease [Halomonas sp.]WFE72667.1 nitrate ABC transporter permease [Halomonas sp. M1]